MQRLNGTNVPFALATSPEVDVASVATRVPVGHSAPGSKTVEARRVSRRVCLSNYREVINKYVNRFGCA